MYKGMTTNLMVESVDETVAFYCDILDFELLDSVSGEGGMVFAILGRDGLNLMAQRRDSFLDEYPSLNTERVKASVSLYIKVDNLDEEYEKLKTQKLLSDIHETFYGAKEFAIEDNSGYVLTFAEA